MGDWAVAKGAAATFSPVMPISTCTCVGSVPSPTMPMSRFMDATASFTGVSLEMPKKVRSAETLSAKDAGMVGRRAKPPFSQLELLTPHPSPRRGVWSPFFFRNVRGPERSIGSAAFLALLGLVLGNSSAAPEGRWAPPRCGTSFECIRCPYKPCFQHDFSSTQRCAACCALP